MKTLTQLTPRQQDLLKASIAQYHVQVDPRSQKEFVRFMGEDVEYRSVLDTAVLLG